MPHFSRTYYLPNGGGKLFRLTMVKNNSSAKPLNLKEIDKTWTLFLDRDGVINEEVVGEYVLHWDGFLFTKGALEAFKIFSQKFGRIIIVTNQRGVSKGLMTENDLLHIHKEMQTEVELAGGRIDKIYYCTDLDDNCFNRKPNPGMAMQAAKDFPDINFSKSIMAGNKNSDMLFGRATGMFTIFIASTNPEFPFPHPDVDLRFPLLSAFAQAL
jgi:histidinol-phosphate phosphatase family protein